MVMTLADLPEYVKYEWVELLGHYKWTLNKLKPTNRHIRFNEDELPIPLEKPVASTPTVDGSSQNLQTYTL
jgi:hypothetical protein